MYSVLISNSFTCPELISPLLKCVALVAYIRLLLVAVLFLLTRPHPDFGELAIIMM